MHSDFVAWSLAFYMALSRRCPNLAVLFYVRFWHNTVNLNALGFLGLTDDGLGVMCFPNQFGWLSLGYLAMSSCGAASTLAIQLD